MRSKNNDHAGAFALITIALVLPFAAWNGLVVSNLWGWFVSPLGVRHVGIWEAAGLYLIVRFLTFDTTLSRDDDKPTPAEKFATACVLAVILPAFVLGFGAIYHGLAA